MGGLLSKSEFLRGIRSMDEYRFERFVADVWTERGFETTVRSGSGDRGIDVVATRGAEKQLIQAKRYCASNKVGSKAVREYATLYQQVDDVDSVVIITTSSFTEPARKLARDLDIDPVDGEKLFDIVNSHAPNVAVEYLHQQRLKPGKNARRRSNSPNKNSLSSNTSAIPSPTDVDKPSPFENEDELIEIKSDQDLLTACPDCGSSNIWLGKIRKGVIFTLLKCADCESVWAIDDAWPNKPVSHRSWNKLPHESDLERKESGLDPCFIATAAYGTPKAQEIDQLRDFRDEVLLGTNVGETFVDHYYKYSPPVAEWISHSELRKIATRKLIIKPSLWVTGLFSRVLQ